MSDEDRIKKMKDELWATYNRHSVSMRFEENPGTMVKVDRKKVEHHMKNMSQAATAYAALCALDKK